MASHGHSTDSRARRVIYVPFFFLNIDRFLHLLYKQSSEKPI